MHTSKFIAIALLAVAVLVLSCVSPFYGTARIEKGFHMDAGVAATNFLTDPVEYLYATGGRADLELRYGFSKYLQLNGRLGGGAGYQPLSYNANTHLFSGDEIQPILDGALGFQAACPFKEVTPAVRVEAGKFLSVVPLLGLGGDEILTIGTRLGISFETGEVIPLGTFLTIHPCSRFSIFAGASLGLLFNHTPGMGIPPFTVGIAYKLI